MLKNIDINKFLENGIITDVHFKDMEESYMKEKRLGEFERVINKLIEKKIKRVFFLGDIFNQSNISTLSSSFMFFNKMCSLLLENDIEIIILVGNHEKHGNTNVYSFLSKELRNPKIHIFNDIDTMEFDNFNGIFVPFLYPEEKGVKTIPKLNEIVTNEVKEKIQKIRKNNNKPIILFNHNIMNNIWFYQGLEMKVIFPEFEELDFTFGGHIHQRTNLKDKNGDIKGMYVGSFIRSFVYEEESEGYITFEIEDNKVNVSVEDSFSYEFEKIIITDYKDLIENQNIREGVIYDINIDTIKININNEKNNLLVDTNVISTIEDFFKEKGAIIKKRSISNNSLDNTQKERNDLSLININSDKVTILKNFLKRDGIKRKNRDTYIEKLEKCINIEANETNILTKTLKMNDKKLEKNVKKSNELQNFLKNEL